MYKNYYYFYFFCLDGFHATNLSFSQNVVDQAV